MNPDNKPVEENNMNEETQLVVFKLSTEEYAVDISHVSEIRKMLAITRVPKTPEYYLGVMNLRGSVLPVIDLKKRLVLPNTSKTEDSRIIILKVDDIPFGITVDGVSEVSTIQNADIEPPSSFDVNVERRFVTGVGKHNKRLLIMLNVREIIGAQISRSSRFLFCIMAKSHSQGSAPVWIKSDAPKINIIAMTSLVILLNLGTVHSKTTIRIPEEMI